MPIYEYECSHCRLITEMFQSINDPIPKHCPQCNKKGTLKRLISNSSFILKGKGWYETDYGKKKGNKSKN